jgi:hypothetical protein
MPAISITSGGGFLPLTNATAPTPATLAVRMTWTVVKPVNKIQPSGDLLIQFILADQKGRIQGINNF